jgi:hypothetical protein
MKKFIQHPYPPVGLGIKTHIPPLPTFLGYMRPVFEKQHEGINAKT